MKKVHLYGRSIKAAKGRASGWDIARRYSAGALRAVLPGVLRRRFICSFVFCPSALLYPFVLPASLLFCSDRFILLAGC